MFPEVVSLRNLDIIMPVVLALRNAETKPEHMICEKNLKRFGAVSQQYLVCGKISFVCDSGGSTESQDANGNVDNENQAHELPHGNRECIGNPTEAVHIALLNQNCLHFVHVFYNIEFKGDRLIKFADDFKAA